MNKEELAQMAKDIHKDIEKNYDLSVHEKEHKMLSELATKHVMAESQWNLLNARKAILTLADGKIDKIPELVRAAQKDFRDVIYWATLDRKDQKP